jgi:hypothetical protein
MSVIIDFEGFLLNQHHFIVKEFAFYNLTTNERMCYFFQSPKLYLNESQTRVVIWLTKNIHGIEWNYGSTEFDYIYKIIHRITRIANTVIYVKGEDKKRYITELCGNKKKVVNLETIGCPKFEHLYYPQNLCGLPRHIETNHCALKKVVALATWYRYATHQG